MDLFNSYFPFTVCFFLLASAFYTDIRLRVIPNIITLPVIVGGILFHFYISGWSGRAGNVTAVFSMKGGQGVTSIAINLADQINLLTGDKVLIVDLNLYMGDVSVFLELPSAYTPFDMVKDLDRMDKNLLFSSLTQHPRGFYILTAPDEVNDAEQLSSDDITRLLQVLRRYFDHIIIDLPHNFNERNMAAIDTADNLLLIVQQSMPVIKNVQKALKLFEELGYDEKKVKVVLNRCLTKSELTAEDISYVLNWPVFASINNDFIRLTDIINKGKTIDMAEPDLKINRDMEILAGLLTGIKLAKKSEKGWSEIISRFLPLLGGAKA
ncbi:MAG: AAA family ATPase [Deltaproteobacteria bacterium]|nr:AAA family ATPase [Deltaproteobacteria bacterium]